jgi:HEAT repeat protein
LDERAADSFVDKLIGALNHPVPAKAAFAARLLGERRERRALAPLLRVLASNAEPELQEAVVYALGEIGDAQAALPVINILNNSHAWLRARLAAADALAKIGTPEAIAALKKAQRADSDAVARAAWAAIEFSETVGIKERE